MRTLPRIVLGSGCLCALACGFDGSGVNSSGNLDPSVGDDTTSAAAEAGSLESATDTAGGVEVGSDPDSIGDDGSTSAITGDGTTAAPGCADWWDLAWTHRRPLFVEDIGIMEAVTDVPVLVLLDASRVDYDATQDAGQDLRFVAEGTQVLPHEIERWDETGTSYVWVRLPMIAPDGNGQGELHLYYGNAAAADAQVATDVWANGYVSVHHMVDFADSTGHGHDGASPNLPTATEGWIGGAARFDGMDDRLTLIGESAYDFTDAMTVEAWIRVQSFDLPWQAIVTKGDDAWRMHREDQTSSIGFGTDTAAATNDNLAGTTNVADGQWHWAVVVYGDALKRIHVDGMQDIDQAYPGPLRTTDVPVELGSNAQVAGRWFDGDMDEIRISNVARTRTWIRAQHRSMTDALLVHGTLETCP